MTDTLTLLQTRRSVSPRLLVAPGPTETEIETLLTIASRVPDHGRVVPWRMLVISQAVGRRLGDSIAALYADDHPDADEERLALERTRLARAPLVIGVVSRTREHPKAPEWEQILSAGAVCMNLVIAANAMGYATSWHTEWYAYEPRFLHTLGLEPTERIAGFVHIGTATERPTDRERPPIREIVTRYA